MILAALALLLLAGPDPTRRARGIIAEDNGTHSVSQSHSDGLGPAIEFTDLAAGDAPTEPPEPAAAPIASAALPPLLEPDRLLGAAPFLHGFGIRAMAFNASGTTLWSGSSPGAVVQWSVPDGRRLVSWEAHPERLQGLALSGDRPVTVGSTPHALRLWSPQGMLSGEVLLPGAPDYLALSGDGKTALVACWPPVEKRAAQPRELDEEGFPLIELDFPPDTRGWQLLLVDLARMELVRVQELPVDALVMGVEFLGEEPLALIDGRLRRVLQSVTLHEDPWECRGARAGNGGQLVLAVLEAGPEAAMEGESEAAGEEPMAPPRRLASWTPGSSAPSVVSELSDGRSPVDYVPAGRLALLAFEDGLEVWNLDNRERREMLSARPSHVAVSPSGSVGAWCDREGQIGILDLATCHITSPAPARPMRDGALALAPHPSAAELLVGDKGGVVTRWSLPTGELLGRWATHQRAVTALAWHPDGRSFACAGRDQDGEWVVRLCQAREGEAPRELARVEDTVLALAWEPQGGALCAIAGRKLSCWSFPGGTPRWEHEIEGKGGVLELAYTPDGRAVLLSGGYGRLELRDAVSGDLISDWRTRKDVDLAVWLAPDGRVVTGDSEGWVRVRALPDGRELAAFRAHAQGVSSVRLLPGGLLLSHSGKGRELALWSGEACLARFGGDELPVGATTVVSADGRWAVAGGLLSPVVPVWDLSRR